MKKVMFLLATLLIGGMMFTGCKKDNPQPTPDTPSTPTETTKTFVYKVNNTFQTMSDVTGALTTHTISPCFHYTFSYKDADGKMVEVTDATLPWTKEISVKTPFEAQLKGKVTYNESEIPTPPSNKVQRIIRNLLRESILKTKRISSNTSPQIPKC